MLTTFTMFAVLTVYIPTGESLPISVQVPGPGNTSIWILKTNRNSTHPVPDECNPQPCSWIRVGPYYPHQGAIPVWRADEKGQFRLFGKNIGPQLVEGRTWSMIFGYNWDKDFQCNIRTLEAMLIRNPFRLELKKPHFHIISGFKKRYINASDDLGLHEDSMDIPGYVSQWDHCVIVARLQHLHQIGRDIIEDCVELFPTAKFGMCAVNDQIVSAVKTEFLKDNWLHFSNLITYFPGGFFNLIYW